MAFRLKVDVQLRGGPLVPEGTVLSKVDVGYRSETAGACYAFLLGQDTIIMYLKDSEVDEVPETHDVVIRSGVYFNVS